MRAAGDLIRPKPSGGKKVTRQLTALLLTSVFTTTACWAGPSLNPVLDEPFSFRLGAYFMNADGTLRSTRDGQSVDNIDLDTLGIDEDYTSAYFGARWRFAERWRLTFNYFGFDSDGKVTGNFDDLDFGDIDVTGFATIKSSFKTEFYVGQVGYSFLKNERAELGVGLGLHVVRLKTKLTASGEVNEVSGTVGSASTDITAPLPDIRAFGTYAFTPKLSLDGQLAYFTLGYDKYSGDLFDAGVNLEYRFTDHFGAGVGYRYLNMKLKIDKSQRTDKYDLDFKGPVVFVSAGF